MTRMEIFKDLNLIMLNPFALKQKLEEAGIVTEFVAHEGGGHLMHMNINGKDVTCAYFFINEGPVKFERKEEKQ